MCNFASFVLTKNDAYYLDTSDSHEDIIEYFNLKDDSLNLIRIEMIPPRNKKEFLDVSAWRFQTDLDIFPDWTYKNDPALEEQARKALVKRINEQHIGQTVENKTSPIVKTGFKGTSIVGNCQTALSGDYGISQAGDYSNAVSGDYGVSTAGSFSNASSGYGGESIVRDFSHAVSGESGKCISGNNGISNSGDYGISVSDACGKSISGQVGKSVSGVKGFSSVSQYGKAISGDYGVSKAGNGGKAEAGKYGTSSVGDYGLAIVGLYGKAKAGLNGEIQIYINPEKFLIATVDNQNILPDTFYKVENGKFVPAE